VYHSPGECPHATIKDESRRNMKACIVCSGEIKDYGWALSQVRRYELLIAADGGANHLEKMGVIPHVIIGDLDSIDPAVLKNAESTERISFPEEKDKTDTELAVALAFDRGASSIDLLGATGGRLDHTLGNISLAVKYPGRIAIRTAGATLEAVDHRQECRIKALPGSMVSLIPYPTARNVTTKGLKYSLEKVNLSSGTRGISNVLCQPNGSVAISGGLLLVYTEHGRD